MVVRKSTPDVIQRFHVALSELHDRYRPSKHPFFSHLATCQTGQLKAPGILDEFYRRYQAAMHATRAMVYFLPHLDAIQFRIRKLHILADDDGISGGDSHHCQLRRTWEFLLERQPLIDDDTFGELNDLIPLLDSATANFVLKTQSLYPKSLGPWLLVEGLAHDWIGALLNGLIVHFPGVEKTAYFIENYTSHLEIRHAEESIELASAILSRKPQLIDETLHGAAEIGGALDLLWGGMDRLVMPIAQ